MLFSNPTTELEHLIRFQWPGFGDVHRKQGYPSRSRVICQTNMEPNSKNYSYINHTTHLFFVEWYLDHMVVDIWIVTICLQYSTKMLSINPGTISCHILHIHFENLYDKGECNFELKRTNGKMLRYYILILLQKSCKLNNLFEWCNTINLINKL